MNDSTKPSQHFNRSLLALLLLFCILAFNGFSIFYLHLPFPPKIHPQSASFSPENIAGDPGRKLSPKLVSSVMSAVKEDRPLLEKVDLSILHPSIYRPKRVRKRNLLFRASNSRTESKLFSKRVKDFLAISGCKVRFFMTWISSLDSFGDRELFAVESLFKSNPLACLIIVSNSIDSTKGIQLLKPFIERGLRVTAISPDFNYLLKNTPAELWFNRLSEGNLDPGEVSLGQNLSNLLRLSLLYKFGGIYVDTDVIVLKSFSKLRNSIGAQTIDLETGNWSRLNNAVLVFDKQHPLLFKFIQEFALTFDGNKWGHNGPYLVSRVVSRVNGRQGFNFTVLPPSSFYPVYWNRIESLFEGPRDELQSKWLINKLGDIQKKSFTVHLWNKQSRNLKVEEGSVIHHIMSYYCIFCNNSASSL